MTAPASHLASPSATRAVLERYGLSAKKALGQNFLVNDAIVSKIVELSGVGPADDVLEVGPGIGTLTVALLARARSVCAVERDPALPAVLAETCAPWADRFTLLAMDALDLTPDALPAPPGKLIANLPYAVAATVVLGCFEKLPLSSATVMVQAEVADRMTARPGTKSYGAYTVKLGLLARAAGRFAVSPANFMPRPHVNSAVVRLDRLPDPLPEADRAAAALMADAAFAARRKTLANSCRAYFAGDDRAPALLDEAFARAGIDPARRGEALDLEAFVDLGRAARSCGLCA